MLPISPSTVRKDMTNDKDIAAILRSVRGALGWSQPQFAKYAGVSVPTLARIETLAVKPQLATVAQLMRAIDTLGFRVEWRGQGAWSLHTDSLKDGKI